MIDFTPAPVRILVENSRWLKEPKVIYPKPLEITGPIPLEKRRGRPPSKKPGSVLGRKRARRTAESRQDGPSEAETGCLVGRVQNGQPSD